MNNNDKISNSILSQDQQNYFDIEKLRFIKVDIQKQTNYPEYPRRRDLNKINVIKKNVFEKENLKKRKSF